MSESPGSIWFHPGTQVGGPDTDPPVLRDVTYVLERRRMGAGFFCYLKDVRTLLETWHIF